MPVTGVLARKISVSRQVAFSVLREVADGAFASDRLRISTAALDSRDAALASQIVFGCLRYRKQLDYLILLYAGRPAAALDRDVAIALRCGIYQLRYLDRIPAHAAVHDAVELTKAHKRAAAGLVNAVLRKVNRQPVAWPDEETELSCPAWLLERWTEHFGAAEAREIARAALSEPVPYVRVPEGSNAPQDMEIDPTSIPGCYRLRSAALPGLRLHDIGAQTIVPLLGLQPGHRFLDLCAAPGNKTLQALESRPALAVACDVSYRRAREIPDLCYRVVLDASCDLPFGTQFDRILVDAPCSGTGTLARNPEIKWRLTPQDIERHKERQLRMLKAASALVAPGGKLVYATCSLEREENEDVVYGMPEEGVGFKCEQQVWRMPGRDEGDGFYAALLSAR